MSDLLNAVLTVSLLLRTAAIVQYADLRNSCKVFHHWDPNKHHSLCRYDHDSAKESTKTALKNKLMKTSFTDCQSHMLVSRNLLR